MIKVSYLKKFGVKVVAGDFDVSHHSLDKESPDNYITEFAWRENTGVKPEFVGDIKVSTKYEGHVTNYSVPVSELDWRFDFEWKPCMKWLMEQVGKQVGKAPKQKTEVDHRIKWEPGMFCAIVNKLTSQIIQLSEMPKIKSYGADGDCYVFSKSTFGYLVEIWDLVIKVDEATKQTGMKYDQGKPRYDLLPGVAIDELAKVLTFGAEKYAPNSWQEVENGLERYRAALLRHTFAIQRGELIDEESGLHHSAHAMTCAAFIVELEKKLEKKQ